MAELAIEPSGADNDIAASGVDDCLFASQFSAAIGTRGVDGLGLIARSVVEIAAEDIIGRDVDEGSIDSLSRLGEIADSEMVDSIGGRFVGLGLIDIRIGGTVDDNIDRMMAEIVPDSSLVGNVEVIDVDKRIVVGGAIGGEADVVAELTVGTSDENIHGRGH